MLELRWLIKKGVGGRPKKTVLQQRIINDNDIDYIPPWEDVPEVFEEDAN